MKLSMVWVISLYIVCCIWEHRVKAQAPRTDGKRTLVFADEFDEFDLSRWEHEITAGGGGNWEFQYYVNNRSNSFVEDGILYLKPTLTTESIGEANLQSGFALNLWGSQPADVCTGNAFYGCERFAGAGGNIINPIQSARIRTSSSFNFKYGHVQIRAKLPKGDWIWPAIWLLPRYNQYGNWPASGEIDIMEARGNDVDYPKGGVDSFGSTLHMGPNWEMDDWPKNHGEYKLPRSDFSQDYHIFGLVWDEDQIYTYIDTQDQKVMEVKFNQPFWKKGGWDQTGMKNPWKNRPNAAPFDQAFYLIFNVAVGGTGNYFPDGVGGKPWVNADNHAVNSFWGARGEWLPTWRGDDCALKIDYVRVYQ